MTGNRELDVATLPMLWIISWPMRGLWQSEAKEFLTHPLSEFEGLIPSSWPEYLLMLGVRGWNLLNLWENAPMLEKLTIDYCFTISPIDHFTFHTGELFLCPPIFGQETNLLLMQAMLWQIIPILNLLGSLLHLMSVLWLNWIPICIKTSIRPQEQCGYFPQWIAGGRVTSLIFAWTLLSIIRCWATLWSQPLCRLRYLETKENCRGDVLMSWLQHCPFLQYLSVYTLTIHPSHSEQQMIAFLPWHIYR